MGSMLTGVVAWLVMAGEPAWVNRGSGAFPADKRSFYGVGIASGVKNPALLRSTADNRARAEVGKVFEVYSAQLMKDYLSTEGQSVEQATKTFSAGSMQGAEIVDRYLNGEGVQYSLCVLNLDKAKELIEAAQAQGAIKSVVQMNADKAYDELVGILKSKGKTVAPAAPAAEVAKPPAPTNGGKATAPEQAREQASNDADAKVRKGGGRPAWIDSEDPNYPWSKYLYAVGFGKDRASGENGALAGLSKIFEVRVNQVAKDFVASYSRSDKPKGLEIQGSSQLTETSTNKSLTGVRIVEVWSDGSTTTYALALLDRAAAASKLRDQISELDATAKSALDKSADSDKIKQVRALNQAMGAIQEREALNSDLRVINSNGIGVAPELSYADVYEKLEGAQEALNVGIIVEGPMGNDLRASLASGLTELGYAVSEVEMDDDDEPQTGKFDLLIVGEVRHEKAGKAQGGAFEVVRAVADFKLKNVKKNKIIDEYTVSAKEGHKTVQEASRRATRELQKIIAPEIAKRFQKYLTKK